MLVSGVILALDVVGIAVEDAGIVDAGVEDAVTVDVADDDDGGCDDDGTGTAAARMAAAAVVEIEFISRTDVSAEEGPADESARAVVFDGGAPPVGASLLRGRAATDGVCSPGSTSGSRSARGTASIAEATRGVSGGRCTLGGRNACAGAADAGKDAGAATGGVGGRVWWCAGRTETEGRAGADGGRGDRCGRGAGGRAGDRAFGDVPGGSEESDGPL